MLTFEILQIPQKILGKDILLQNIKGSHKSLLFSLEYILVN